MRVQDLWEHYVYCRDHPSDGVVGSEWQRGAGIFRNFTVGGTIPNCPSCAAWSGNVLPDELQVKINRIMGGRDTVGDLLDGLGDKAIGRRVRPHLLRFFEAQCEYLLWHERQAMQKCIDSVVKVAS